MKQKVVFLFFCMIFEGNLIFSQKKDNLLLTSFIEKLSPSLFLSNYRLLDREAAKQYLTFDFYETQIGFFCKEEIKFEKFTKIAFSFRLGSVEVCDRMEGKLK